MRTLGTLVFGGWVAAGCGARTNIDPLDGFPDAGETDGAPVVNDGFGGASGDRTGSGGIRRGPVCGNGRLEAGEACDGFDLGGETCASVTMFAQPSGVLRCVPDCTYDISSCYRSGGTGGVLGAGGFFGGGGFGLGGFQNPGGMSGVSSCETTVCPAQTVAGLVMLPGCCSSELTPVCGLQTDSISNMGIPPGCQPRDSPGVIDPACPAQVVFDRVVDGCCRPGNFCGADLSLFGLGCVDMSSFRGQQAVACAPSE